VPRGPGEEPTLQCRLHSVGQCRLESGLTHRSKTRQAACASLSEKSEVRLEAVTDARWQPAGRGVNEAVVE
jgi:hypothetical protein